MYLFDRVCETSVTTGTSNLTLAGAVTGFQTFNASGAAGGNDFHYLIEAVDGNGIPTGQWEVGIGKCPTTTSLQRVLPITGSAAVPVNFAAGTKRVHLIASAYELGWRGAVAHITSDLVTQNYTTSTAITWTAGTSPDTDAAWNVGFWDGAANTKLKLPATGYDTSLCEFSAQLGISNATAGEWVELLLKTDNTTTIAKQRYHLTTTAASLQIRSPIVSLGFNDYAELFVQVQADTSITVVAADSWFQLDIRQ